MRKTIIRTTLALAAVSGVGVLHAGNADALPPSVACQDDLIVATCVLATAPGFSEILLVDGDGYRVRVVQAGSGFTSLTDADAVVSLPGDGIVFVEVLDGGEPGDSRELIARGGVATPDGNLTGLDAGIINRDGAPDRGLVGLYRSEDDADTKATSIEWSNGDCEVHQNGDVVAPCVIEVVPQLPYAPFVWLP